MPELPKTVAEVMTRKLVTISKDDTLGKLEDGMIRFRFRHLPVVEDGKLIGVVSHRDLLHASSSFLSNAADKRDEVIHKQPASAIMQREMITIRPTESLVGAASLMWEAKLGCLPVTEEDGTLLGILTEADFIRLFIRLATGNSPPPPPSTRMR